MITYDINKQETILLYCLYRLFECKTASGIVA